MSTRHAIALTTAALADVKTARADERPDQRSVLVVAIEAAVQDRIEPVWEVWATAEGLRRRAAAREAPAEVAAALVDGSVSIDTIVRLRENGTTVFAAGRGWIVPQGVVDFTAHTVEDLLETRLGGDGLRSPLSLDDVVSCHTAAAGWPWDADVSRSALNNIRRAASALRERYRPAALFLFGYPAYVLPDQATLEFDSGSSMAKAPQFILDYQAWAARWSPEVAARRLTKRRDPWEQIDEHAHGVHLDASDFEPEARNWPCSVCVPWKQALQIAGREEQSDVNPHCAACRATRLKLRTIFTAFRDYDLVLAVDDPIAKRDDLMDNWHDVLPGLAQFDRDLPRLLDEAPPFGDVFFWDRAQLAACLDNYAAHPRPHAMTLIAQNCWFPPSTSEIDIEANMPASVTPLWADGDLLLHLENARRCLAAAAAPEQTLRRLQRRGSYFHDLYDDPVVRRHSVRRLTRWAGGEL